MSIQYYGNESRADDDVQTMKPRGDEKSAPVDAIRQGEGGHDVLYSLQYSEVNS